MATYRDLCTDALVTSTAIGVLDTPTDKEINIALNQLNNYLARFAKRANMSSKKVIFSGSVNSLGQLSIAKTQASPDTSHIVGTIGRVTKVINQDDVSLDFLDFSEYMAKTSQSNEGHNYYTTQVGAYDELIVYTAINSTLQVIADQGHSSHALDDAFDYPDYYWDVFEYGLASKLAISFKVAPEVQVGILDVYKSALSDIESLNFQLSPLNASRNDSGNFYNGYM